MVAQTMVRQLVSKVQYVDLIRPLPHEASETLSRICCLNVSVHALRKGIKGQKVLFILSQAADCLGTALSVLGECSLPVGSMPPALSVAPRCPRVQLARHRALVAGWHSARCA